MTSKPPKPPGDFTLEQFEAMRPFAKLMGILKPEIRERFKEVESHVENVKTIMANRDLFAQTFSPLGWVNYDRMSVVAVADALKAGVEEGEAVLTAYHLDPDNLRFLGYRFHTRHYEAWGEIYERAVERAGATDFLSAVPLILIIIDGICTTTTAKHPFSGGADAPVFDTQTSGPGGLSEGLALLGSTRRKLDVTPISVPYRHGVVHGLNPSFGHAIVAAKAFNLLHAMVDYFDRRRDEDARLAKAAEEQRPVDLMELGRGIAKNAEVKKLLDAWKARPVTAGEAVASSDAPVELEAGTPEAAVAEYLMNLVSRNFGALAKATIDYPKRTIGYRAGRLRDDLKDVAISSWTITGVEDTAAAMTNVMVDMTGTIFGEAWSGSHPVRLMYSDEDNNPLVRGEGSGVWIAMPDFLTNLWATAVKARRSQEEGF